MGIRITWTDTNSTEDGHRVYRSTTPMDPAALPAPLAELGPDATEYEDGSVIDGETWFYRVSAVSGTVESVSSEVEITAQAAGGDEFANAQIGDEIGGGIYAGVDTIDGADYYIVASMAAGEAYGLQCKTSRTATAGATSETDGLANTLAMETAGLAEHPAAEHCLAYDGGGYSDWHMPARSQVSLLYNNLAGHPEFTVNNTSNGNRWSSSEYASDDRLVWWLRFSDGFENQTYKDSTTLWTRPIRRVPVPLDYSTAQIGDEIGGGIYAGTITYGDGRQFHIVAAKQASETSGLSWGYDGTATGALDDDDGWANQQTIAGLGLAAAPAFEYCAGLAVGDYSDWYLPARNEAALLDTLVASAHPEFSTNTTDFRLTSVELSDTAAYARRFTNGTETSVSKTDTTRPVRPIRRVPVEP